MVSFLLLIIPLSSKGYKFQEADGSKAPAMSATTGWKLEDDGKHICFTDGCGIGRLHLAGNSLPKCIKVQRQREEFARKQANALVSSSDLIAFEDLQIRNLVKNRHLAKSIHDAGWGTFLA